MKPSFANPLLLTPAIICGAIILHLGQTLFIPLFFGLLIAIVLHPVCKKLEQKHLPRSLAITVGLSLVFVLFGLLVWILTLQLQAFMQDLPHLKAQLTPSLQDFQLWLEKNYRISLENQNAWLVNIDDKVQNNVFAYLQAGVGQTLSTFFMIFIIPVFAALFLYNRETFVHFLQAAIKNTNVDLEKILSETVHTYFGFIKGTFFVYIIVGMLNSIGLLALGVEHAMLFGMITAFMTIIPYFGILISAAVPVSIAWINTGTIWLPLQIVAVFAIVQYLEANIIFPKVVGTQLNVNTWSILVAILAGGIIWGVAGMVLFIPFVGVFKIVSDNIPGWKTLNILLSKTLNKKPVIQMKAIVNTEAINSN
jgi:predicted PurR-regulated permease PerM